MQSANVKSTVQCKWRTGLIALHSGGSAATYVLSLMDPTAHAAQHAGQCHHLTRNLALLNAVPEPEEAADWACLAAC